MLLFLNYIIAFVIVKSGIIIKITFDNCLTTEDLYDIKGDISDKG